MGCIIGYIFIYMNIYMYVRELHTVLSPEKIALCSPRTGHPAGTKKKWRPFVRWPELRPDKSGPAQAGSALSARSPTEAAAPAEAWRAAM
jgi:hypothetical protein